ncbi:MAG: hypothetical protein GF404_09900 [candidate division Zixibacteria bacterium]|nr:hypothetical protein [candidate division Zixibacteria bacterium]
MGLDFINRVIKTTLLFGAFVFIFGSFYFDWVYSLGIFAGTLWGCLNLWFIRQVVVQYITPQKRDTKKLALAAVIKFPVLYFLGFLMLYLGWFPVSSFVIGFSLIFFVVLMKALGKLVMEGSLKNFKLVERQVER